VRVRAHDDRDAGTYDGAMDADRLSAVCRTRGIRLLLQFGLTVSERTHARVRQEEQRSVSVAAGIHRLGIASFNSFSGISTVVLIVPFSVIPVARQSPTVA
jgi:hypothetical protein